MWLTPTEAIENVITGGESQNKDWIEATRYLSAASSCATKPVWTLTQLVDLFNN